ncbi:MAG: flagellin lysine-N-methylase [Oscillospiraceae bacterium]|nr:flagellin lysine-N-methylase [Oscillospiraceae bacterium]
MGYYIVKEPNYFRGFACIGSACESNCCHGWEDLIWLNGEYEKLLTLSDGIRETAEKAFERLDIPEFDAPLWNLKLSDRKCPFLAENSLCSIQREFGGEFISNTCRIYPRVSVFNSAVMTRGCYASCPEVAKTLLNDEFALEMCVRQVQVDGNEITLSSVLYEGEEDFSEYPALRFRNELFGLFYDILSDRKRALDENMLLGLETAKRISETNTEDIPALIEQEQRRFKAPESKPKCELQYNKTAELFTEIFGNNETISAVLVNGKPDVGKISEGVSLFPKYFFRNLALNFLFELRMPFCFGDKSVFENYSFLLSVYSLAKLLLSASALEGGVDLALERLSEFDRAIIHDRDAAEKIFAVETSPKTF